MDALKQQIMCAMHTQGDVFLKQQFSEPKFFLNQTINRQHFRFSVKQEEEHF